MKKSHRKDVMIARIIFAAMCIALIAIIAGVDRKSTRLNSSH